MIKHKYNETDIIRRDADDVHPPAFGSDSQLWTRYLINTAERTAIPPSIFQALCSTCLNSLEVDDPEYNEFKKATSGINSIKILTQDGGNSESFGKELLKMLAQV